MGKLKKLMKIDIWHSWWKQKQTKKNGRNMG